MSGTTGQWVVAVVFAVIGFFIAGPSGAMIGFSLGWSLGGVIDPPKPPGSDAPDVEGPKIDGVRINMPSENQPINYVLGSNIRVAGNLIWAGDLLERRVEA